jgi:hypothetical protein
MEVRAYLNQQEEETQKIWEQIEANADYQSLRKRLLARRQD